MAIAISSIILLFAVVVVYIRFVVTPVVKTVAEEKVRALTVSTVNAAVTSVLEAEPFVDMVEYGHDANGDLNSIKINATRVNAVMQRSVQKTQNGLSDMISSGVNIPVGSVSGITFLSGKGPNLNVAVIPVGSVDARLRSEFSEIGINQTIHKIYLSLDSTIKIIIPGAGNTIKSSSEVLLVESVIIGKVPDTYLNATTMEDMMDLIG